MKFLTPSIVSWFLSLVAVSAHSQDKFYVEGAIDGINDGQTLSLFRYRDGSIDAASSSTVHKGKFLLTDTASHPTLYWILGSGDKIPSQPLEIWGGPGITIHVSGRGSHLKTWNVRSSLREQQEENQYLAPSMADWDKVQEIDIQQQEIRGRLKHADSKDKDSLEGRQALLDDRKEAVLGNIERAQIELLQKRPVTEIWMHKMWGLSFHLMLDPKLPYRESLLQLYKRMADKQRTSLMGEKITANLFPPAIVKVGDTMADMPLLDSQMVPHKLAEYKGAGKYLLLDFGFINCGPCLMSIPETKVLHDSLVDKLTIIGINVDETAYWRAKSKENPISWVGLNDSRGRSGLANSYGVKGYPYYVILSPDGIVLGAWMGYEKGELTQQVTQYIKNN